MHGFQICKTYLSSVDLPAPRNPQMIVRGTRAEVRIGGGLCSMRFLIKTLEFRLILRPLGTILRDILVGIHCRSSERE